MQKAHLTKGILSVLRRAGHLDQVCPFKSNKCGTWCPLLEEFLEKGEPRIRLNCTSTGLVYVDDEPQPRTETLHQTTRKEETPKKEKDKKDDE